MKQILKCPKCLEYTLKEICAKCNVKTENPRPARFSLEDKFGKYRRIAKKES